MKPTADHVTMSEQGLYSPGFIAIAGIHDNWRSGAPWGQGGDGWEHPVVPGVWCTVGSGRGWLGTSCCTRGLVHRGVREGMAGNILLYQGPGAPWGQGGDGWEHPVVPGAWCTVGSGRGWLGTSCCTRGLVHRGVREGMAGNILLYQGSGAPWGQGGDGWEHPVVPGVWCTVGSGRGWLGTSCCTRGLVHRGVREGMAGNILLYQGPGAPWGQGGDGWEHPVVPGAWCTVGSGRGWLGTSCCTRGLVHRGVREGMAGNILLYQGPGAPWGQGGDGWEHPVVPGVWCTVGSGRGWLGTSCCTRGLVHRGVREGMAGNILLYQGSGAPWGQGGDGWEHPVVPGVWCTVGSGRGWLGTSCCTRGLVHRGVREGMAGNILLYQGSGAPQGQSRRGMVRLGISAILVPY